MRECPCGNKKQKKRESEETRTDLKSDPWTHLHFLGGLTLTQAPLAYHYGSGAAGIHADCEMVNSYRNASELQTGVIWESLFIYFLTYLIYGHCFTVLLSW